MIIYQLRKENGSEIKTSSPEEVTIQILDGYRLVGAYDAEIYEKPVKITREEYEREIEKSRRKAEDESGSIPSGSGDESDG